MNSPPQVFNRKLHRLRRNRAAATFNSVNFLKKEACARLAERLEEITRDFTLGIELGAHQSEFESAKISRLIRTDSAESMLRHLSPLPSGGGLGRGLEFCSDMTLSPALSLQGEGAGIVCDEEHLPFAPNCADAVVSALSLHWVNDLPGTLIQIQRMLKPDGVFLAVLPGAKTLIDLRSVLEEAETEITGGISPHVSPFVEVRDAGNLLMRAGFALPMADSEILTVSYEHMFALLKEIRAMGEGNALLHRAHYLRRDVLMRAAELYQQRYGDNEGRITATVELVFLTGWKPHPSQPQPAKRGSGQVALGEALDLGFRD